MKQTEAMESVIQAKRNCIPLDGAWVFIQGNPYATRGARIPSLIHAEGVHHLDLIYVYDEQCPWGANDKPIYFRSWDSFDPEDIVKYILNANHIDAMQLTWVTLHTPSSQLIRMWNGDISGPISQDSISNLLKEGYIEIMPFSKTISNPVWDDETRDIIGSLMLDGYSLQQAQDELIRAGEKFDRVYKLPSYFYRPIGWFYDQFCEEPEWQEGFGTEEET